MLLPLLLGLQLPGIPLIAGYTSLLDLPVHRDQIDQHLLDLFPHHWTSAARTVLVQFPTPQGARLPVMLPPSQDRHLHRHPDFEPRSPPELGISQDMGRGPVQ